MALRLVTPARKHRRAWKQLNRAFRQEGPRGYSGIGRKETWGHFLRQNRRFAKGRHLPKGYVPGSKYFLMDGDGPKILGIVSLRHRLNDHLLNNPGGHIGYAVAPSERRRGYGTEQLRLALEICRDMGINPVLITCHKENAGSAKVIRNNGGVLEDERLDSEGKVFQRYWIAL